MAINSQKKLAFSLVKSYLGYSWGAWKVLARCLQLGPPIPAKEEREWEQWPLSAYSLPWWKAQRNLSQWRVSGLPCKLMQNSTALAGAGSTTVHKGHWHFSTWLCSRKAPAEIECCCCWEHQWRHMQLHFQVPLLPVFACPGITQLSPFQCWRCPSTPELLHWGLTVPTCTGSKLVHSAAAQAVNSERNPWFWSKKVKLADRCSS